MRGTCIRAAEPDARGSPAGLAKRGTSRSSARLSYSSWEETVKENIPHHPLAVGQAADRRGRNRGASSTAPRFIILDRAAQRPGCHSSTGGLRVGAEILRPMSIGADVPAYRARRPPCPTSYDREQGRKAGSVHGENLLIRKRITPARWRQRSCLMARGPHHRDAKIAPYQGSRWVVPLIAPGGFAPAAVCEDLWCPFRGPNWGAFIKLILPHIYCTMFCTWASRAPMVLTYTGARAEVLDQWATARNRHHPTDPQARLDG